MSATIQVPQLANSFAEIEIALEESQGCINHELEARLQSFLSDVDTSAEMLERMEAFEEYLRAKASKFEKMARGYKNAREFMKTCLKEDISKMGMDRLVGNERSIIVSNSKPKLEIDEATLDPAYLMQVTTTSPDKKRIEEDLKLGVPVKGASLVPVKSLKLGINKKALA